LNSIWLIYNTLYTAKKTILQEHLFPKFPVIYNLASLRMLPIPILKVIDMKGEVTIGTKILAPFMCFGVLLELS